MDRRKTVALVIDEISGNYQNPLYCQIVRSAKEQERDLLVFEGKSLHSPLSHERESNVVYEFLNPSHIDLAVLSGGSLFSRSGDKGLEEFLCRHGKLPLVLLNNSHPGIPSLTIDNGPGIRDLCRHLYEEHGVRRFAFVTGTEDNTDSRERLAAFLEFAKSRGIPRTDIDIRPGTFHPSSGREAIKGILESGSNPQAIMFANDDMAIAALEYINGEQPEHQNRFIITGFDNVANSALTYPSLTTVNQPMDSLVRKAVEMTGLPPEERRSLSFPTFPVYRRSCGCRNESLCHNFSGSLCGTEINPFDFIHTHSMDTLYDNLSELLNQMEVSDFFIILYDRVMAGYETGSGIPALSRLAFARRGGKRLGDGEKGLFPTNEILFKAVASESPFSYVIKPLFLEKLHFGLMVCETKIGYEQELEIIRGLIGNTIQIDLLTQEKDQLANLLPICSHCKKIRDDKGYWRQVEDYISRHSEIKFTHGLCPDCVKELYPQLFDNDQE